MSKIAFIYPGQGAQKCGMGRDFYENSEQAERYFDDVCGQLDFDLKKSVLQKMKRSIRRSLHSRRWLQSV